MNLRNIAIIFVFIVSLSFAEENNKKEDGIKIYKRLIPADVLRGKLIRIKIDVKKRIKGQMLILKAIFRFFPISRLYRRCIKINWLININSMKRINYQHANVLCCDLHGICNISFHREYSKPITFENGEIWTYDLLIMSQTPWKFI